MPKYKVTYKKTVSAFISGDDVYDVMKNIEDETHRDDGYIVEDWDKDLKETFMFEEIMEAQKGLNG